MKIALAPSYRNWMFLLLPMTLGLGTAALWLFSLKWPLSVDDECLTLRDHRKIAWNSIRKIVVSRSYLDGHVSHVRIHYKGGVTEIRVNRLQHGEDVVRIVRAMFELVKRSEAQGGVRTDQHRVSSRALADAPKNWSRESAIFGNVLLRPPESLRNIANLAEERI